MILAIVMVRTLQYIVFCVMLTVGCVLELRAQISLGSEPLATYAQLHGTWFHGRFVQSLSSSRSLVNALSATKADEPLWIRIDSTNQQGKVLIGKGLGATDTMMLLQTTVPQAGLKWVMGRADQPMWLVTHDAQKGTYLALTPLNDLEGEPIVMGALPSKNPDPVFILRRMVNSSLLVGSWKSSSGQTYAFSNSLVADFAGQRFPYQLSFSNDGSQVRLTATEGRPRTWSVERSATTLVLREKSRPAITLTRIP